ncbi:MAG: NAD(P)/FAD-dependent oxidoreductase [Phascolarctobacterium faecium]
MKYDIAIIGGGPAGLSAAITASSKGRKVVVFEAHGFSPRLRSVELITDYMGCPDISGNELMDRFIEHARHIGAEIIEEKIVSLKEKAGYFELGTPNSQYNADTVILATGISVPACCRAKRILGRGGYCAKVDGAEYKVSALLRSPLFLMRWKK